MKYAVDKIDEDIVVLENISTGEIITKRRNELPDGVCESNIVVFCDNKFILNNNEEKERKESLRERLERLKNLNK